MSSINANKQKRVIDNITSEQAMSILNSLWDNHPDIRKKIEKAAEDILSCVEYNDVCEDVRAELDSLDEEDLFDRSGPSHHGYHDPSEVAGEMLEEAVKPFQDQMNRYFKLEKQHEATEVCKGILKALYTYNEEADSQFADYATDWPGEMFGVILRDWNVRNKNKKFKEEMNLFIEKECEGWSKINS